MNYTDHALWIQLTRDRASSVMMALVETACKDASVVTLRPRRERNLTASCITTTLVHIAFFCLTEALCDDCPQKFGKSCESTATDTIWHVGHCMVCSMKVCDYMLYKKVNVPHQNFPSLYAVNECIYEMHR